MKKRIHLLIILSCLFQHIHAQEIEKKEIIVDAVYRYTPLDSCFYKLLDTLSSSLQNCVFNMLSRDYYFYVYIYEDNEIRGQIYSYESYPHGVYRSGVLDSYREAKKANKGFLYYNEKLVLVTFVGKRWSQFEMEKFFSRRHWLEAVMYSIPAETLPEEGMAMEVPTASGFYDPTTGNLTVTKFYECRGEIYYSYTVKEGDTWGSLAAKFATTVENIRTLNGKYDRRKMPEKGHPIEVCYRIVDGALEAQRIATRFDW